MKSKQVRAVVRLVDLPSRSTGWFPSGDRAIVGQLIEMLPAVGENFMVVWQEREVTLLDSIDAQKHCPPLVAAPDSLSFRD